MLLDGVLYYPHEDGVEIRGGKSKESPVLVTVNPGESYFGPFRIISTYS